MKPPISPQIFLLSWLAGWLNQEQQKVLDYLREENRPRTAIRTPSDSCGPSPRSA
jgi:hypothetical protein